MLFTVAHLHCRVFYFPFFFAQQLLVFHHLLAGKMNDLGELNFNIIIDFDYYSINKQ